MDLKRYLIHFHIIIMWVLSLLLLSTAAAFSPFVKENVVIRGSTPPLKDFDPLQFSSKFDIAYLREAELKHGRWGMIAATAIPLLESTQSGMAIHKFDALDSNTQACVLTAIAAGEFQTMLQGWKNPISNQFELQDGYQPGDLGFSLVKEHGSLDESERKNKEINNGRLAMIAALGMIVQELVTDKPLF